MDDRAPSQRLPPYRYLALGAAAILVVYALLTLVVELKAIFFLGFFAVVLATILHIPITWLSRFMPRPAAAVVTLLSVIGVLAGIVAITIPVVQEQGQQLIERAPLAIDRLQSWWDRINGGNDTASIRQRLSEETSALLSRALPIALTTLSAVTLSFVTLALAMFLAYRPRDYLNGIVRLMPKRHDKTTVELLHRTGYTIRAWMTGTLVSMTVVGSLTALGLLLIGIDSWLVLGILMFFGEFIPFFGPFLAGIPGVAVGLADSTTTGLYVFAVYMAVQQIEAYLVQPVVMKRAVRIQPAVLIFWQALFATAFGFPGLLVATPLLAALQAAVGYLYVEKTLEKDPAVR